MRDIHNTATNVTVRIVGKQIIRQALLIINFLQYSFKNKKLKQTQRQYKRSIMAHIIKYGITIHSYFITLPQY